MDTLHLAVDADVRRDAVAELQDGRAAAGRAGAGIARMVGGVCWTVADGPFIHGRGHYHYSLSNGLAEIGISENGSAFPIFVKFKCQRLWEPGDAAWETACGELYEWLARATTGVRRITVSKIALTVDYIGLHLSKGDDVAFAGPGAKLLHVKVPSGAFDGFVAGSRRRIFGRIGYDKLKEIRDHSHKEWFLAKYGEIPEGETIRRVEFEFNNDALRDVPVIESADLALVLASLDKLWTYATTKWLRLTDATAGRAKSRWRTRATWAAIQNVRWPVPSDAPVATVPASTFGVDARLAPFAGSFEWLAGVVGRTSDLLTAWWAFFPRLVAHYSAREAAGGRSFAAAVVAKATDEGVLLVAPPTSEGAVMAARTTTFPDEPPNGVPDDVWTEILRELRSAAAVLMVRGDPTPATTAMSWLMREAEANAPMMIAHDLMDAPYVLRETAEPRALARLRALYKLATIANCTEPRDRPPDLYALFT